MRKVTLTIMTVLCLSGFSGWSYADEMSKMKTETKEEMKNHKDIMKGEMKAGLEDMKSEKKAKQDSMKRGDERETR